MRQIGMGRGILIAAMSVLIAHSALAQRTSPQFSFPAPGTLASQFGADVFAAGSQDLGPLNQATGGQPGGPSGQSSTLVQLSGVPQSAGGGAEQAAAIQRQPEPQLSRPSLSLSSLASSQAAASPPAAQPVARAAPQQSQPAAQAASAHREHQPSRQAPTAHRQHQSAPAANPKPAAASPHQHQLHTQQTSQALNAGSNQAAIEAARRAEATAASIAASAGQNYRCPDSFGYFRHHKSCDKYYACENGTATLKLCGNGLMFDDSDPKRENCAYPFSVDCGPDRTDLEAPISTPHCPRLYGLFADTANCRVFYSCWNGESSKYECPPGLAYDNEQRVCVWADLVDRCDQSEVSDGFVCPDPSEADQPGHYTRHAHPTDCRKFYVCIEGVARPYGCSFGSVFNVDSLQCDEPENVGGCEKYYGELDPKLAKKLARENAQGGAGQTSARTSSSSSSGGAAASSTAH